MVASSSTSAALDLLHLRRRTVARNAPPIHFKYLDLGEFGGRGGVVRFFLLSHGIRFTEKLYGMADEWPAVKQQMIESRENPAGTLPVVKYGDKTLTQHVAIMRYIARQLGITSGAEGDHAQDAVADEYQAFRDEWVAAAFGSDEELKTSFKKVTVPTKLWLFDELYATLKQHQVFLSVKSGKPLWGDSAVFGLVRDLILTGMLDEAELKEYPRLSAMVAAYAAQPAVAAWVAAKKPQAVA